MHEKNGSERSFGPPAAQPALVAVFPLWGLQPQEAGANLGHREATRPFSSLSHGICPRDGPLPRTCWGSGLAGWMATALQGARGDRSAAGPVGFCRASREDSWWGCARGWQSSALTCASFDVLRSAVFFHIKSPLRVEEAGLQELIPTTWWPHRSGREVGGPGGRGRERALGGV